MSAFVCTAEHIGTLVGYCAQARSADPEIAASDAETLAKANIASVRYRYPDVTGPQNWPGPEGYATVEEYLADVRVKAERYAGDSATLDIPPVHILKLAGSSSYQSCEVDDWQGSPAWYLLDDIRSAALARLPGWDRAPWTL